ncbi:MAG TPA: hypothetical protein VMW56_22670 [Candidatus Margulisiibacteriota bacterium]|nr:hypothetical protein [Candidatus Margulisiibacteriota bacterium]
MNTRKFGMNPSGRLETGAAVLAAAKAVDIERVRPRLNAFAGAHRRYAEAQREVEIDMPVPAAEVSADSLALRVAALGGLAPAN